MIYAIGAIILAALAAVFGYSRKASKAEAKAAAAEKTAADAKLAAAESRHETERAADKVKEANTAVGEIDADRQATERRNAVLMEERFNAPKVDPTDPRPGASRLLQAAGSEAVPDLHRDPGEDR